MSDLIKFNFQDFGVRVIIIDNVPWFVAVDVARIFDYKDPSMMLKHVDDDDKIEINPQKIDSVKKTESFSSNTFRVSVVNESGLYAIIFGSTKPEAKAFKKWVTSDVLPSIRKTGSYTTEKKVNIYARRVQIASNWNIPKGHFCVFHEMSLLANKVGEKYDVGEYDLIDGSVGKCWSGYRKDKEWALPTTKFHIFFGDKRDLAYPEATAYQLEELTYFRKWLEDIYQFENMPRYLATKYKDLIKV